MFKLEFKTDNSVFHDDPPEYEIHRILDRLAMTVLTGQKSGPVHDISGNTIGSFEITDD